jgi:hypothetical protein
MAIVEMNLNDYLNRFTKSAYLAWSYSPESFNCNVKTKRPSSLKELTNIENRIGIKLPTQIIEILKLSKEIDWRWSINTKGKRQKAFINWSLRCILLDIKDFRDCTLESLHQNVDGTETDFLKRLKKESPYLKNIANLSIEYIQTHIKNLIPLAYVGNGSKICFHKVSGEIYYQNHDPSPGFDGYGLYNLAPNFRYFIDNFSKIGFRSGLEIEELSRYFKNGRFMGTAPDVKDSINSMGEIEVPQNFSDKYIKEKKLFGIFSKF